MGRVIVVAALLLASCARQKDSFLVVDPRGSIVLRTDDEEEAWRLVGSLAGMGRKFASDPQYFVVRAERSRGRPYGAAPEPRRW